MNSLREINNVVTEYGLYGQFVEYNNGSSPVGAGKYFVIGPEPVSNKINPYKIYNKIERDTNLFYPKEFAVPVNSENYLVALDRVTDYCRDVEFLINLYKEFDAPLPDCIRYSELAGLKNWAIGRFNEDMPDSFRIDCAKGLKTFFKNEKSITGQEKRRFFRSSRYDEKATLLQRRADFANRASPIVRLPVLLQNTDQIGKKRVGSAEFEAFCNYIKDVYPDIIFSVSEKEVIDLGLLDLARRNPDHPAFSRQKPVTNETFRNVIKDRFATEGFACTNDIQPVYWEYYDIYYRKADEPRIITAYNDIFLRFADHDPLQNVMLRGSVDIVTLSVDNFHYFVAYAKAAGLKFNIDHRGVMSKPSFTDIHVIYSMKDKEIVNEIINKVATDKAMSSHIGIGFTEKKTLESKIKGIQSTIFDGKTGRKDDREKEF